VKVQFVIIKQNILMKNMNGNNRSVEFYTKKKANFKNYITLREKIIILILE